MVVVAGVLALRPADQPDIDVGVAVQLCVLALGRVESHVIAPDALLRGDRGGESSEYGTIEIRVGDQPTGEPGSDVDVGHDMSRLGVSCVTKRSTDSPKPFSASRVGAGSTTGKSLP